MTDDLTAMRKMHENARTYGQATVDVPTRSLVALLDRLERAEAAIERVQALHHKDPYDVSGKYCVCEQLWPCLDACALDTGKETG